MPESAHQRLRRARIAAGYKFAADAARAFGWDEFIYRSHESGRRKFDAEWADRYGKALRVPSEWLLLGRGQPRFARIEIVSYAGAGAAVYPIDGKLDDIDAPPGCPEGAFGVIVRGDSMWPAYEPGDVLICAWVDDPRSLLHRRAVLDLASGERLIKQLEPGPSPGSYTLLSVSQNASPRIGEAVDRAAKILFIVPR